VNHRTHVVALIAGLAELAGIGAKPSRAGVWQAVKHLSLSILDSSTIGESCEGEGTQVWRIEVRSARRTDTLGSVVQPWPFAVGDTAVYGVAVAPDECTRRLLRHSTRTGRTMFYDLPADMWHYFWDVSVSPNGGSVLYLAMDNRDSEFVVVRALPAGPISLRGPRREGCDCDVDRHHAHWVTADSFELATLIRQGDVYERVSGSLRARRIHVDTVKTSDDYWHPPLR